MRNLVVLLAFAAGLYAQAPNRYYISASTTKLTIQQPASGGGNQVQIGLITVACAADQTMIEEWNGAAATATAGTIKKAPGTFQTQLATAWTGSNVGTGTTGPTYTIPGGQTVPFDGSGIRFGPTGTGTNYSIGTSGACTITIAWSEGIPVAPYPVTSGGAVPMGPFGAAGGSISGTVTVNGAKSANAVVPGTTNLGVLPCVANAAAPSFTETFQVPCSVDLSGGLRVVIPGTVAVAGAKSSNAAVPGATNVGTLPCVANAAAPTVSETFQVPCSVDLAGSLRTRNGAVNVAGTATPVEVGNNGGALVQIVNAALTDGLSNTMNQPRSVAEASNALAIHQEKVVAFVYNGNAAWDRQRSTGLVNSPVATALTARPVLGSTFAENTPRWTVVSTPAANSQASASIALEASTRHIVDTVCFSATSNAAVVAANGTVDIRDGATGAGTVIAQFRVVIGVAAAAGLQIVPPYCVTGLNLAGTTGTAMTAEFSAGVTGATQSVTMTGYNVN